MNVLPRKLQLIMICELGYFLDHFFYLVVAEAGGEAGGFYFEVGAVENEAAVVEVSVLLHEVVEVYGVVHFANLGAEDGLFATRYRALLIGGEHRLKTAAVNGYYQYGLCMIVIRKLAADLLSILLNVFHDVHSRCELRISKLMKIALTREIRADVL